MALSQEWHENERRIIGRFFSDKIFKSTAYNGKPCDEESCIQFARNILSTDDIRPVDNQGDNSFTLISHQESRIIQFRLQQFDNSVLKLAHQIYGDQVPEVVFHSGFPLPVYTSNIIPGKVFFLLDTPMDPFPLQRQLKTITDLAIFVAKATRYPQSHQPCETDSWTISSKGNLERLLNNKSLQRLAPELVPIIKKLHSELYLLDVLPHVLTHNDFTEINILVDETDGRVTGVIDFDQAAIEAFGTCIWGVYEGFLGTLTKGEWSFFDQDAVGYPGNSVRQVLEATFWSTLWSSMSSQIHRTDEFEQAVKVAARVGVIHRYFVRGMFDEIVESDKVHRYSLGYARGILPAV